MIIVDAIKSLSVVLRLDSRIGVGNSDGQLFRSFNNRPSYTAGDRLAHGSSVRAVVHHEHFQFRHIVDDDCLESMGMNVARDLIGTITNRGMGDTSLEFTANAAVDTNGLSPRRLDTMEKLRLVTNELLCSLLYNSLLHNRNRSGHFSILQ